MNMKNYFDKELTTTVVFAVLGIVVGYISFLINNSPVAFLVMVIVGAASVMGIKKARKLNEDKKWWLGNGVAVYIFMWFISWIILYNAVLL